MNILSKLSLITMNFTCNIAAFYSLHFYFERLKIEKRMSSGMKFYWFMYNKIIPVTLFIRVIYWIYNLTFQNQTNLSGSFLQIMNLLVFLFDLVIIQYEQSPMHFLHFPIQYMLYRLLDGIENTYNFYLAYKSNLKENFLQLLIKTIVIIVFVFIFHYIFTLVFIMCLIFALCENFFMTRFSRTSK